MELITTSAYGVNTDSDRAAMIDNLYGPPVILIGASLVTAGIALLRRGRSGWAGASWLPAVIFLLGVYVFVPLTPAIMGTFVAGRLGIGGWMLLFASFGLGLARLNRTSRTAFAPAESASPDAEVRTEAGRRPARRRT